MSQLTRDQMLETDSYYYIYIILYFTICKIHFKKLFHTKTLLCVYHPLHSGTTRCIYHVNILFRMKQNTVNGARLEKQQQQHPAWQ